MKKQKLQIISAVAVASMLMQTSVFAFGGTYPDYSKPTKMEEQELTRKDGWTQTDKDYLFTVGSKKFILLDTDAAGNYFVMADDVYGKHAFDTTYSNTPIVETRTVEGDKITYVPGPANQIDDTQWMYNPTDSTNIGYWLNNDFLTGGNEGNVLPASIKENIVEKTWTVEGYNAFCGWTARDFYDVKNGIKRAAEFAATRTQPQYTVGGKISLMSYTEYKKYQDIIGFMHGELGYDGFMLRSPHANITAPTDGSCFKYAYGGSIVKNQGNQVDGTGKKMVIVTNDAPARSDCYYVRPVMWLSKDVFKNVKCDVNTVGSITKAEILKNTDQELGAIYSPDEIKKLKGKPSSWVWGQYPEHPTDVKKLTRAYVNTGTLKGPSPAENLFTIDGRRFIMLDRNVNGEYFIMADEEYGQYPATTPEHIASLPTDKKLWVPENWAFNPAVKNSMAFFLNSAEYGYMSGNIEKAFKYRGGYTGDTSPKMLPQVMLDDIIDHDWQVEPFYPEFSWKTDGVDNPTWAGDDTISAKAKGEIRAWLDSQIAISQRTTMRSKLNLLSFTEYNTYKDKIGFNNYLADVQYAGTFLRTPYEIVDGGNKAGNVLSDSWSLVPGFMTIVLNKGVTPQYQYASITDDKYMIRPVMWLAKDFFKNNKIDVNTAGSTVLTEMKDLYTTEDLIGTYTLDEIHAMGIGLETLADVTYTSMGIPVTDLGVITELTVSATATNLGKNNQTMIVSVYSKGKLIGVNFTDIIFDAGVKTMPVSVTVDGFRGARSCKVMVWSGLNGTDAMAPVYITGM